MSTIYRIGADVLSVNLDGEIVLLDYNSGNYLGLRGAVCHAFELLRSGATLEEMASEITSRIDVGEDAALRDLEGVIGKLAARGLVTVQPQA